MTDLYQFGPTSDFYQVPGVDLADTYVQAAVDAAAAAAASAAAFAGQIATINTSLATNAAQIGALNTTAQGLSTAIGAITVTYNTGSSDRYAWKVPFSGGETPLGVGRQGQLLVNGQTLQLYEAPTLRASQVSSGYVHWIGQSLCTGRKSVKPDDLFAAMQVPVAPGFALMFGNGSPRIKGTDSDTAVSSRAAASTFYLLGDAKEAPEDQAGATSAWSFMQRFCAYRPDRMNVAVNTGVGGTGTDAIRGIANGSRMATNRRAAIIAYAEHCRFHGLTPFSPAVMVFDQGNADRTFSYAYRRANLEALFFDEFTKEIVAAGGDNQDIWFVLGACAEIYATSTPCSDIHDVPLDMAKAYANVCLWGPEYILETAVNALAAGTDGATVPGSVPSATGDLLHPAAIAQARKGFYQEFYLEKMLSGAKVLPLHVNIGTRIAPVTGNATVTAAGLVTLTYENWRGTNLVLDTSFVTDPGVISPNIPYGFAFAPGVGSGTTAGTQPSPSTTIRPRASSFAVTGANTLKFQLETMAGGAISGVGGLPANPRILVANFWDGAQQGGPDRGARACLRNNGMTDTRTIVTAGNTYTFPLHDYAVPQTIPLTLV